MNGDAVYEKWLHHVQRNESITEQLILKDVTRGNDENFRESSIDFIRLTGWLYVRFIF